MLPWILFASTAVIAAFLQWRITSRSERLLKELKQSHVESLVVQDNEHKEHTRRLQRQFEKDIKKASFPVVQSLLPSLDALWQAIESAQQDNATLDAMVSGLELIQPEVLKALKQHDIIPVVPEPGDSFDPHQHEAIGTIEHVELSNGTIGQVIRMGWTHPVQVIRPTLVQTVKNPSVEVQEEEREVEVEETEVEEEREMEEEEETEVEGETEVEEEETPPRQR